MSLSCTHIYRVNVPLTILSELFHSYHFLLNLSGWDGRLKSEKIIKWASSDIFRLENLSVWQIPVFRHSLLTRNPGYIEFEMLEKQWWSYLRNIKTAINYFFYKRYTHNLSLFLTGKFWLNIGICQTLGFSILKMSPLGHLQKVFLRGL
jgi:hypothetical protein